MGYRFPSEHERRIEFSSAIAPESGVRQAVRVPPEPSEPPADSLEGEECGRATGMAASSQKR